MNENHTITLQDKKWGMPVRVLTLITFFLGAFTLVQAILLLSEYYSNYDVSMPVVILFLLITPFAFVAALMFAFGVHKIAQGNGADKNIILGFAMMLLLAVDNLIYIPIHYRGDNGDPLSFMILGAIELICLIIFFLYYQNWGNKALTFCAKEESINTLLEMASYKETAKCKLLVAAGCLAQRYHKEIQTEIPEVDIIVGTMGYENLAETIRGELKEHQGVVETLQNIDYLPTPLTNRDSMSGGYYAYLKIAEGCDKCCTYCVIPKVRGHYRSVPMENLLAQAEHLVQNGAKELILVAQETTLYGVDLYGHKSLPELLEKLSELEELKWIRILYCYPEEITKELVHAIKTLPKVCHYLDIPIQRGSDGILKRMGRRTNSKELRDMVHYLRQEIPDIALRTTLITGFPGESEQDFEQLKEFVEELRFDRLGVFTYSREEDTPAAAMEEQVPEEVAEKRRDEIMQIQQKIAFEKTSAQIGRALEVMVEGALPEDGVYITRTYMDAPEVLFQRASRPAHFPVTPSTGSGMAVIYIILPPPDDNFPDSLSSENIKSDSMSFLTSPVFMYLRINSSQYQP